MSEFRAGSEGLIHSKHKRNYHVIIIPRPAPKFIMNSGKFNFTEPPLTAKLYSQWFKEVQ
jgi:hypothetical protein